ncbi:MAG: thiamine pyrophosphate-dependent enzyme [Pseudobdellovibrionaceae bacterium]
MTGNEMIAEAAKAINFHFMGYYPITPSTEIAQLIDAMKVRGEVSTVLLPADGEHGAAGACFGASTAGARVLNATSANGFLYSLEQLPVQAGSRLPMVLNLVTRSVSGPLDIRCDHSDLMFALQTGWIVLLASTPQAAYDMNIIAVKLGEHPEVRLPVMVVTDGFFTSHQRQSAFVFKDQEIVQKFLGDCQSPVTTLNPRKPVTVGPYMNDPDLINNKYQLHKAHEAAMKVFVDICKEYETLTGRHYDPLEEYKMEGAQSALFLLNSAAETAKDAIDHAQEEGKKVGLLRPNILRPFPFEELKKATHKLSSIVIGERSDTPGSQGGPLGHEVRSALLTDRHCDINALVRIYGLGGKDFREEDASDFIEQGLLAIQANQEIPSFSFVGTREGAIRQMPPQILPSLSKEEMISNLVKVEIISEATHSKQKVKVHIADPSLLVNRPKRIAPGHGACPGCGIFSGLDQFFKGIEGDVVVLYHTGCAMVVTTDYPFSSHRVTYVHNLFQNGAPTLSGLVETFYEKQRRGEIPTSEDITFIMITGDGGMDIGMGPTIGTALRNHKMIILEYDNQGYMNTGGQLSYTTPFGKETATSHVGKTSHGKSFHHKDTLAIMAATGIPYVFSAIEGFGTDLVAKAAKAQWYAKNHGLAFGKILVACPLNWGSEEKYGLEILQRAADSCFFPIYEIENGLTTLNYDPESGGKKIPVKAWLEMMSKEKHLLRPEHSSALEAFQNEVDRRWKRLKAMAAHELL